MKYIKILFWMIALLMVLVTIIGATATPHTDIKLKSVCDGHVCVEATMINDKLNSSLFTIYVWNDDNLSSFNEVDTNYKQVITMPVAANSSKKGRYCINFPQTNNTYYFQTKEYINGESIQKHIKYTNEELNCEYYNLYGKQSNPAFIFDILLDFPIIKIPYNSLTMSVVTNPNENIEHVEYINIRFAYILYLLGIIMFISYLVMVLS